MPLLYSSHQALHSHRSPLCHADRVWGAGRKRAQLEEEHPAGWKQQTRPVWDLWSRPRPDLPQELPLPELRDGQAAADQPGEAVQHGLQPGEERHRAANSREQPRVWSKVPKRDRQRRHSSLSRFSRPPTRRRELATRPNWEGLIDFFYQLTSDGFNAFNPWPLFSGSNGNNIERAGYNPCITCFGNFQMFCF